MSNRGSFTNERGLPLEIRNSVEINGHLIVLMLVAKENVLKLVVDNGDTLNTTYDIYNPHEIVSAYADFSAYVTAATQSNSEREITEKAS